MLRNDEQNKKHAKDMKKLDGKVERNLRAKV
jgi:hypothetical protein